MLPEDCENALGFEALSDQISVKTTKSLLVGQSFAAAELFRERVLDLRVGINCFGNGSGGPSSDLRCDASLQDLAFGAPCAAALRRDLVSGDRLGNAPIVYDPFLTKTSDGRLDGRFEVTAAPETLPDLSFRELAPREHLDRVDISSLCGVGHDAVQCRTTGCGETLVQAPNRVISGLRIDCAIWSRLKSEVVEIPCTFSLNSSTLLAQRRASS
jgi:hypothetical protein